MSNNPTTVRATYPVFLEIARRRQSIRRTLAHLCAQPVTNPNTYALWPDIDPEMRELMETLGKCIVPRSHRRAVVRTNYHAPYYSSSRYRYI